ncbi:hypothetical protein CSUI_008043 [Cystoisospora suis]|uniref:Transmembrane protein n=1 Tax=Cystoisospora suis TaxID=483139 RepID=A0A2C6KNS5_9APIC|nr:hypothetical protein CSUI_008043 [Cystoisospora suis]
MKRPNVIYLSLLPFVVMRCMYIHLTTQRLQLKRLSTTTSKRGKLFISLEVVMRLVEREIDRRRKENLMSAPIDATSCGVLLLLLLLADIPTFRFSRLPHRRKKTVVRVSCIVIILTLIRIAPILLLFFFLWP